jgi:hypothetical protein
VSRSKHTRPRPILAADRVRSPYEPRGRDDKSSTHCRARLLKEMGLIPPPLEPCRGVRAQRAPRTAPAPAPLPRMVVKRPREGYVHPAGKGDIARILRFFGEQYTYGLRRIVLVQAAGTPASSRRLVFGRLRVRDGEVILYEQAMPPWVLPGRLSPGDEERLVRAGAILELSGQGQQTVVRWPAGTLRDFMLFDVLMHEIAHHTLQQYKGKRALRVARTAHHEALAHRFAVRCRLLYTPTERA